MSCGKYSLIGCSDGARFHCRDIVVNRPHSGVNPAGDATRAGKISRVGRASLRREIVRSSYCEAKEGVVSKPGRASEVYRFFPPLDSRISSAFIISICIPVCCAQQLPTSHTSCMSVADVHLLEIDSWRMRSETTD